MRSTASPGSDTGPGDTNRGHTATLRLILAVGFAAAYAIPLFFPPPTAAPIPMPADAALLERLFPGVPGIWVLIRLLSLLAAMLCLGWSHGTGMFVAPPPYRQVPSPRVSASRMRAALACAAAHALAAPFLWSLNRPLQLLYVAWFVVPIGLLTDWGGSLRSVRANRRTLLLLSAIVATWVGLRVAPTWQSPLAANLLDDWRGLTLLKSASEPSFNLLVDRGMSGAGTALHFMMQGAGWAHWMGIGPTFQAIQGTQFLWIGLLGIVCGWITTRMLGLAAGSVATATLLFSPIVSMFLVSPLPLFYGPLLNAAAMLLLTKVRYDGSTAALAALASICGVAHHSMLPAAVLLPFGFWFAWRSQNFPKPALAVALLSFLASIAAVVPDLLAAATVTSSYSHGKAQWTAHEMAGFGQVSRVTSQYLLEAATPRRFDMPLSAMLAPFAMPRTPMRLVSDALLDPVGSACAALGLMIAVTTLRRSWAARVTLVLLIFGLLPAAAASTDRISINRISAPTVAMAMLSALGWERIRRAIPNRRARDIGTATIVIAIAAGGTVVFDIINPRLLYSSWTTIVLESLADDVTTRAVLLDHPEPHSFPDGYLEAIVAAVHRPATQVSVYNPAAPFVLAESPSDATVFYWNPGLEEDEQIAAAACRRWPRAVLYTFFDTAQRSRAYALIAVDQGWRPSLPAEQWTSQGCDKPLYTEARWADAVIQEAAAMAVVEGPQAARAKLRDATARNFGSVALFAATAQAVAAAPSDDGSASEALFWAQRAALAARRRDLSMETLLADAYAAAGYPEQAIETAQMARALALKQKDSERIAILDARLRAYHQPQEPADTIR